ncbi:MAG: deoxyguanosinetriphosphate triphosphohydrolase [Anaerolineales bacterium]
MIVERARLERLEDQALAPFGFRSRRTRGRAYPEDEPRYRTVFQRDRDRILHTTAFRRLEYKTQVFVIYEGDYYRTRLTHTLEVAQIGRTVARALGANEDLVEAICLAHDLGHPPFGHAGEASLDGLMAGAGGFDHNRQSLRIVTELERRFPEFPGLNLTWEVREGIVKHETEYDLADAQGYDPELRGDLEAQIANAADELAYSAHDLDDGLRSGLITTSQLDGLRIWRRLNEQLGTGGDRLEDLDRHRVIRRMIGHEVDDLLAQTSANLAAARAASSEDIQRLPRNVVEHTATQADETRELKDFLYQNMYRHPRVLAMQAEAERTVTALFEAFLARPELLPAEAGARVDDIGLPRAACDYIAGMTDRFATQERQRLTD